MFDVLVDFIKTMFEFVGFRNHGRFQVLEYRDVSGNIARVHEFDGRPQMVERPGKPHLYPGGEEHGL